MTKSRAVLWIVAILATGYGLPSVFGAFLLEDVTPVFRAVSSAVGLSLVAGAGLLFQRPRIGVALLWISAGIYALVMLVPALQLHGVGAFSVLMGAFYISVGVRVGLAAIAHAVVQGRHG